MASGCRQSSNDVPDPAPRLPTPSATSNLEKDQPSSPRVSPEPEIHDEMPEESDDAPVIVEHEPPSTGLGEGPSAGTFIRVPRNPFTMGAESSESKPQPGHSEDPEEETASRPPPVPCSPTPNSRNATDPEAKKLWEVLQASRVNPEMEVHKLEAISSRLADQHQALQVCLAILQGLPCRL
jgi:hypothetical protein